MAPETTHHISVDVQGILNRTGKTVKNLSDETGISQVKLSRLIANPGRFSIDDFAALTKALPSLLENVEVV